MTVVSPPTFRNSLRFKVGGIRSKTLVTNSLVVYLVTSYCKLKV